VNKKAIATIMARWKNGAMESWNHRFKVEAIHGECFSTRPDAKKQCI
jgi:hypothetical protein